MISAISRSARRLQGRVRVPGDKSISHRALILGALALGETTADGLLEGEDVLATARAMRALGAGVERLEGPGGPGGAPPRWRVRGNGMGALTEPQGVLDLGNSGTGARLLAGVLAAQPFTSVLSGDESLSRRPMGRVTEPLTQMGARFETRSGGRLPMTIMGARMSARALLPVEYTSPVASAQVKSAVLLAGLHAPGETTVIEPAPSRDHTERMLRHFGAEVRAEARSGGALAVTVTGEAELAGAHVKVPGDPSSAAFALAAGLLADEGAVTAEGVSANPLRSGFLDTLLEMGADLTFENVREEAGEPVHDVTARPSKLRGAEVPAERAPAMIDEYPVLAVLAAFADGETRMNGLAELRVKESDRIAAVTAGLRANGADAQDGPDWMAVGGTGARPPGGGTVTTHLDHRIAMAFLVMGMGAEAPVTVDDITPVATSFPGFAELMNSLGAGIEAD
ncbi:MAG: 3-phosphoshikimate 1-carboxyvinyltransferase [Rhodospirillales bacterium]